MPVALLLSIQRSGSNFLRGILGSQPALVPYPEVFEEFPNRARPPTRIFWEFYLEQVRGDATAALPQSRRALVETYLEEIEKAHPGQTAILDVKYDSLHHANGIFHAPSAPPIFAELVCQRGDAVIFLQRRNVLRQLVSLALAQQSRRYHAYTREEIPDEKVALATEGLADHIRRRQQDQQFLEEVFRAAPRQITLCYEDLWEGQPGGTLRREPFEELAAFLGVPADFDYTPTMVKITPHDLSAALTNFDEVEAALRGTDAEWMLRD